MSFALAGSSDLMTSAAAVSQARPLPPLEDPAPSTDPHANPKLAQVKDDEPEQGGPKAIADPAATDTQTKVNTALAADRSVTELNSVLRKGDGSRNVTSDDLKTRVDYASSAWKDVKDAVDYELRLAAASGTPGQIGLRREQVARYSPHDGRFERIVNDSATRVAGQSAVARTSDMRAHELKQTELSLNKARTQQSYDVEGVSTARDAYLRSQADIKTAVTRELDQTLTSPDETERLRVIDLRLNGASPELAGAIHADPRIKGLLEDSVSLAYQTGGTQAGAQRLREITDQVSPDLAAQVLNRARPTLDAIGTDLQWVAGRLVMDPNHNLAQIPNHADQLNDPWAAYRTVTDHLSAATDKAVQNPANQPAVDGVADTLMKRLSEGMGAFGIAMAPQLAEGKGIPLATTLVSRLNASGDSQRAGLAARGFPDALNQLRNEAVTADRDYGKARAEMGYLQASHGFLANPQDAGQAQRLNAFWNKYGADHPEIAKTQQASDALANRYLKLSDTITQKSQIFAGLEPDVNSVNSEVAKDPHLLSMLGQSADAPAWLAKQVSAGNSHHPVVAQLSAWNLPREARTLYSRTLNLSLGNEIGNYRKAVESKNLEGARQAIANIRQRTWEFGFSSYRKDAVGKMLDSVDEMLKAADDPVNGAARFEQAMKDFSAAETDPRRGPSLHPSTPQGFFWRALGVGLVAPIVANQAAYQIRNWYDPDNTWGAALQTFLNGATTLHQAAFLGMGAIGGLTRHSEAMAKMADHWAHHVDVLAFFSAVVEGFLSAGYLFGENRDIPMGLMHGVAAYSNANVTIAYAKSGTSWAAPAARMVPGSFSTLLRVGTIGGALSSAAIYAYGMQQNAQEAAKYETETTSNHLQAIGFSKDVADELRDQDMEGGSPLPRLNKLFTDLGYDMSKADDVHKFVGYVNGLGPEKAGELVRKTHGVVADDQGQYPQHDPNVDPYLALSRNPQNPVDPATHMRFDPVSRRWVEMDPLRNPQGLPRVYNPETGRFVINGHPSFPLKVQTMDGLKHWMIQHDYNLPAP